MAGASTNQYLRDAVLTASQEQLQMMLYDGAIRFAMRGREAIEGKDFEKAFESLSRAQKIMLEMQDGLNFDVAPDLCERMSSIYMFIYRKLIEGCTQKDLSAIDDALRLLNYERETWRLVMERVAGERGSAAGVATDDKRAPAEPGSISLEG